MAAPVQSFRSVRSLDDLLKEDRGSQPDMTNHMGGIFHESIHTPRLSQKDEGEKSSVSSLVGRISPARVEISSALDVICTENNIDLKKIGLIALAIIGGAALLAGAAALSIYAYPHIAGIVLSMI